MRVALRERGGDTPPGDDAIVTLVGGEVPAGARSVTYRSRNGALLRIGGVVCGAFDRKHTTFALPPNVRGTIELDVERRSLPQTGLPPRDGLWWKYLVSTAEQNPSRTIAFDATPPADPPLGASTSLPMVGHSHLDVAWLWTYDEAIRKSVRTFATAVRQLEATPSFVFAQTTPQLYDDVAAAEPALYERMRALARERRLDTSGAAFWVESDCNLPSGESLLRQLVFGVGYVEREFGAAPTVAWLPDSFGFANTLPTLLRHVGIGAFGTTKLGWNDTNVFPHPRFVWEGPDGSRVIAANVRSIQGGFSARRVALACKRGDLLLVGYGDGGGGVPDDVLAQGVERGPFTTLGAWFATLANGPLPVVRDELYLEQHRGVLTTHRDIKVRNAALERALGEAELALAWAVVLRATPFFVSEARKQIDRAWQLTLRAQFHDVLPGSAITQAYASVREDYELAERLVDGVLRNARGALPSAARREAVPDVAPLPDGADFALRNERVSARIAADGTLCELRLDGGPNLVKRALRLALYADRPLLFDAWNLDRGYRKRPVRVRMTGVSADADGVEIAYAFGASAAVVRISLGARAVALTVEIAVAWNERHRILRLENDLAFAAERATFGSPHGTMQRSPRPRSRRERARFEACGQRFARVEHARGGVALLTPDSYGWSVATRGATTLGHSLLRGPMWPDPDCDRGEHRFRFALRPFAELGLGALETEWQTFAHAETGGVPMFTSADAAVIVVATKPADDGDGIVVRARECEGAQRSVAIRSAVRAHAVEAVDARERPIDESELRFEDESFVASFRPFEVRSFRVRVG
jgi:alpha-mannosidase